MQGTGARSHLLIVFGALDWFEGNQRRTTLGLDLFNDLAGKRHLWYCARPVHVEDGALALFYLKRTGVVARATIDKVTAIEKSDLPLLSAYGLAGYFHTALRLSNIVRINPFIALKPLIPKLDFINHKGKFWGTSLRASPRVISKTDFDRIMSAAHKRVTNKRDRSA
jgi:hypothetical protein